MSETRFTPGPYERVRLGKGVRSWAAYEDTHYSKVNLYYRAYMQEQGYAWVLPLFTRDKSNAPYICWIKERWREWRKECGIGPGDPLSKSDRDDFADWLRWRVDL